MDKLTNIMQSEDMIKEMDNEAAKRELDVPFGEYVEFTVHKTEREVRINSYKDDGSSSSKDDLLVRKNDGGINLDKVIRDMRFVKRKHYFFYSDKSGYGKSTVLSSLEERCNCSAIQDFNNLSGVRENAQFLTNDEFSQPWIS